MVGTIVVKRYNPGTGELTLSRKGNVDRQHVTLTVLFEVDDNHHTWRASKPLWSSL